jgi:hypothetical protein
MEIMSQRDNILKELEEISTVVAGIGSTNVYDLPDGYFVNLSDEVMEKISELSFDMAKQVPVFPVPEGYFDNFPGHLLQRIHAEEADLLPQEELARLSPLLAEMPNLNPYTTPAGYFNELPEDVVSGAQAIDFVNQELELEASLIHQLERKNVYSVPPGYFFKLPHEVLKRVQSMPLKTSVLRTYRRMISFAAAAMFAGIVCIGAWAYMNRTGGKTTEPMLAEISKLPAEDINRYLDSVPALPPDAGTLSMADPAKDEIKHLLADVSDDDLARYIELHSISADPMTE